MHNILRFFNECDSVLLECCKNVCKQTRQKTKISVALFGAFCIGVEMNNTTFLW